MNKTEPLNEYETYREVRIEKNAQVNSLKRQDVVLLRMKTKEVVRKAVQKE